MSEKTLVNFHLDKDIYHELKMLALRENKTIKEILNDEVQKYIKIHKEGNPQHLITSYSKDTDFIGFPSIAIANENKKSWIRKNALKDDRLNPLGSELWGHVCQWYYILKEF